MNQRVIKLLTLVVLVSTSVFGQEVAVQNTNATTLQWNEIKTPNFNILFPKGFDAQAQRVANTLEFIREPEASSMGVKPKRIAILLQNQTSISNGFVTLAPRRSEFFTMPPQNYNFAGTNDWLSLLASHEYRHIVQYQRSIVGFNKFVYYVFGQQALSLVAFTAAPQWFWEGDAVATETAFTRSGRGRIPNFNILFRTNLLEGRTFNYHKQYLRSYKHNIPDHYVLGYHMITYLRNRTGDAGIWDKVVTRSWSLPFIPFAFSRAIKKEAGVNVTTLYKEMADSLRTGWQNEIDALQLTKFKTLNKRTSKSYIDYWYPQPQEDGSIIALKTGIGEIATIVRLKNGVTDRKFVVGPFNETGMLSAVDGKAVWNEFRYDARWRMKTYSIVKGYDFDIRKRKTLSKKTRYASAAISPDGTKVATIDSDTEYKSRLVVLDYASNKVLKTFDNPGDRMISMPRWNGDGSAIFVIRLSKEGKTMSKYDYVTGAVTDVFDAGNENIGHPVPSADGKYIFYNSPYSGIDNIYAFETSTGKRYQVTSSRYGAYNPAITPDGDWIVYNDQTRDGMDIVSAAFEPTLWKEIGKVDVAAEHFYDKLVTQESHPNIIKDVPEKKYPVAKYNRLKSIVNIHSWGPFFSTDVTQADIGISSRNLLGTTTINAGYLFDINERTGSYHGGISYQGLYPILDFNILAGKRETTTSVANRDVKFKWDEVTATGGIRVPLILTRSKYNTTLTLKNNVGVTKVTNLRNQVTDMDNRLISSGTERIVPVNDTLRFIFDNQTGNGTLLYNQFTFSFSNFLKQSRRDFNPRWAQLLDLEFYNTPYGGDFQGSLAAARTVLYFPGVLKHHSLFFRGGWQVGTDGAEANRYSFRNRVFRPRGHSYPHDTEFRSVSANYALPLWYPDINIGPMLNIQRLRATVFYDRGQAIGKNFFYSDKGIVYYSLADKIYDSVGAEFTVDVNIMRLLPQLDLGLRTTYINPTATGTRKWVVEFVLGTLNL
ncbi:MAG TPA: hypothetical protein VK508_03045 [Cyclobacteriaceae bacterium]|nr:hypothetical protein [Cyclobacteriaceae bacterium]